MDSICINATANAPAIRFGADGKLFIEGRSIRLNVIEFYKPLIEWVNGLNIEKVTLDVNLEYIDTSCSKMVYLLLKSLDNNINIKELIVRWHYEEVDFDCLEDGHILKDTMKKAQFVFYEHPESVKSIMPF
jgi:SiaC family regulatory phosphoprotein